MTSRLGRGLRRFVDSLQRGLFDEVAETPVEATRAGATPIDAAPADTTPRHPRATREVSLDGRRIAFRLVRVRRRSIGFVVDASGLTVRAPKWATLRDIDDAVREKQRWIGARLDEQRERAARLAAARVVWRDGATIDYLGRPLMIVVAAGGALAAGETALSTPAATGAAATVPRLLVDLPPDAGEAQIRDAVQSWLQREARRVFAERAAHFAELLGVRPKRLSLSSAATRWGSANANGSVRLHWRLIQHPLATIDYVVAHELAHLREMNHSARFWSVVRSVVPDYEEARARLRQEGRADV
ncbi:MAG TPA: SprT family zinc-dependent metalloprotease [Caldimonas sp.]|nr:SprT family zinc-dependent metalloprotease [Caldimonas sp.]